jgi:hypothetical protein
MNVYRFPPSHDHRGGRVDLVVFAPKTARMTYRAYRRQGMRPFVARLTVVGLFCGEAPAGRGDVG